MFTPNNTLILNIIHVKIVLFITLFLPLSFSSLIAQIESPSPNGTYALAQGNAFTAFSGHYAILHNHAGIADLKTFSINSDFISTYNNSGVFDLHAGMVLPTAKYGNFGIRIQRFGLDDFNYQKYAFIYARPLFDQLNISLAFNLYQFRINEYGTSVLPNVDIGILTKVNNRLSLGAHIANPLPLKIGDRETFPTIINLGISYKVNNLLAVYADIEKNIYERENIKLGINYNIHPNFTILLGLNTYPATFNIGIGLNLHKMSINLGNSFHQILGNTSGLGLMWQKNQKQSQQ